MPVEYIVFQDGIAGLKMKPQLSSDTLADAINLITNGREGQHWMYFIYRLHAEKIPLFGTRFDCYRYVKAVAGSEALTAPNKQGLEYALTHEWDAWVFTDDIFGDRPA